MICAQARMPGVSVAQVARRYDVNANQIFNWMKDPKFAADDPAEDATRFLPVEVVSEPVFHRLAVCGQSFQVKGSFGEPAYSPQVCGA